MKKEEQRKKGIDPEKKYSFFSHKECEYFPCHKTEDPENFNCLFCYCPLYALGRALRGNFRYTENGIKDCTGCMLPVKAGKLPVYHRKIRGDSWSWRRNRRGKRIEISV